MNKMHKNKPFFRKNVTGFVTLFFSICAIIPFVWFIADGGFLTAEAQNSSNISNQNSISTLSKYDMNLLNLLLNILNNLKAQLNKIIADRAASGIKTESISGISGLKSLFSTPVPNQSAQKTPDELFKSYVSNLGLKGQNFGTSAAETISSISDYYKKFMDSVATKVFFSEEERLSMEKGDDDMRILSLEELTQKAASGYNLGKMKNSFLAWEKLDEKAIAAMKLISVSGDAFSLNNSLMDWFQFHSEIAKKFSEGNLTVSQMGDLYQQFKTKGVAQNLSMKNSAAQIKNSKNFSLINSVGALTCTTSGNDYYFGGMVSSQNTCALGSVYMVKTPCGGLLLLSSIVQAANPYFTGFLKISDNVLGKATVSSGSCPSGCPSYPSTCPYEASMVYYGASGGL